MSVTITITITTTGVGSLVGLILRGTGHAENELASICAETTYFHVNSIISGKTIPV